MTKLSDLLSISRQYEQLYAEETRVRYALSHLYDEVYLFLERIRIAVTENCKHNLNPKISIHP